MKRNKTCGECKYFEIDTVAATCEKKRWICDDDTPACNNFEQKVITNGDKIRQGGDDELMAFKKKHKCDCCIYIRNGNCTEPVDRKDRCEDGLKQWLNAPAESEGKDE